MPDTIIFDTHRFVKRMTDAGLAPPIAEALADEYTQLLERNLSTKTDIEGLRKDIAEIHKDITGIHAKIAEMKVELIKWYVGTMLVFGGILVAAVKLL